MDPIYKQRKVLCPRVSVGYPVMTMARFVPWGIPLERDGIRVSALGRYLGIRRDHFGLLLRKLGLPVWYEPSQDRKRNLRGQWMLIAEEDAARVIVHVRSREGERALRAPRRASGPPPSR